MPLACTRCVALASLVAALGAVPAAADGFYVELEPGATLPDDVDFDVRSDFFEDAGNDDTTATGDIESDPTWLIGGAIGYRFHGFRVELDASYRKVDFDQVTLRDEQLPGGGGRIGDDGDLQVAMGLVNAFYGVRFGRFEPFVGGGLGFAALDLHGDYGENVLDVSENSTEFAWSLSGGVSFALQEHVVLSLGYRYVGMTDPDFDTRPYTRTNPTPPPPLLDVQGKVEIEVVLHEIFTGIRYEF